MIITWTACHHHTFNFVNVLGVSLLLDIKCKQIYKVTTLSKKNNLFFVKLSWIFFCTTDGIYKISNIYHIHTCTCILKYNRMWIKQFIYSIASDRIWVINLCSFKHLMEFWVLLKVPRTQTHRPGHRIPGRQKVGTLLMRGKGGCQMIIQKVCQWVGNVFGEYHVALYLLQKTKCSFPTQLYILFKWHSLTQLTHPFLHFYIGINIIELVLVLYIAELLVVGHKQ